MPHIILSDEQARLLSEAYPVQVLDAQGNVLGHIEPIGFTADEIAAAKRDAASVGPWYTGDEVRAHLLVLEQTLAQEGSMSRQRLHEALDEARSRSQP